LIILSEIDVAIIGWDKLITWLDPLFSPWIVAAYEGRLRISRCASKQRATRLKDEVAIAKLKPFEAAKRSENTRRRRLRRAKAACQRAAAKEA
jgi:hypothetical protein